MKCENDHITSVTAGTALHRSKVPLTTWFYAAYLVSTLTPGISALQFQKQLGLTRYETAFQLLHKLRSALVAPEREPLKGEVEIDELFIGGPEEGKPGRGADKKVLVICAVEVIHWTGKDPQAPDDPHAGVDRKRAGRVRMSIIPDASAETLLPWIEKNVAPGSHVLTDGWAGYNAVARMGYTHERVIQSHKGMKTGKYLPLVHLIISNLKAWLQGTYHGAVSPKHLPAYLNEYVFRFNRRFWRGPAFIRALGLAVQATKRPEYETLYAVGTGEEAAWVHPNPRRGASIRAVDALIDQLHDEAEPDLQVWMDANKDRLRTVVRRAIEERA
jgi:transposase-like protein